MAKAKQTSTRTRGRATTAAKPEPSPAPAQDESASQDSPQEAVKAAPEPPEPSPEAPSSGKPPPMLGRVTNLPLVQFVDVVNRTKHTIPVSFPGMVGRHHGADHSDQQRPSFNLDPGLTPDVPVELIVRYCRIRGPRAYFETGRLEIKDRHKRGFEDFLADHETESPKASARYSRWHPEATMQDLHEACRTRSIKNYHDAPRDSLIRILADFDRAEAGDEQILAAASAQQQVTMRRQTRSEFDENGTLTIR